MSRIQGSALATGIALVLAATAHADDLTFKRRGNEEKKFAAQVGEAVIKAAHGTAKQIELLEHKYSEPKPNRTELTIKMAYHGVVTGKRYVADIVVKIDSSNKEAWEVLNIEYADTNAGIKPNEKKIQDLVKELNK